MNEIEEFRKDLEMIEELGGEKRKSEKLHDAKAERIRDTYRKAIRETERERDEMIDQINDEKHSEVADLKQRQEMLVEKIQTIQEEFNILQNPPSFKYQLNEKEIKPYERYGKLKELIRLGTLYKDKYLNLFAFIYENEKPKNKYSLCVFGRSAFDEKLIKHWYSYGFDLNDQGCHANIKVHIRDAPTVEELKKTHQTLVDKKEKVFPMFDAYIKLGEKYETTSKKYTMTSFNPILQPREVTEEEAPLIFIADGLEYRLYHDFIYTRGTKADLKERDAVSLIRVNNKTYKRQYRKELLSLEEAWVNEKNINRREKISLTFPKIKWVKPELLD